MKGPFCLFAYDYYYPAGGIGDLAGTFVTVDGALQAVRNKESIKWSDVVELVAVVNGKLEVVGDINPSGDVHFEPAEEKPEKIGDILPEIPTVAGVGFVEGD